MKRSVICFLLVINVVLLNAQGVNFTVSSNDVVQAGERFRVVFTVNADGNAFRGPDFKGFSVHSGPSTSTNSSISFINGKTTQSVETSFAYIVSLPAEGSFTIGSAYVKVDGKDYKTNPFTVKVMAGSSGGRQTQSSGGNSNNSNAAVQNSNSGTVTGDDVFVKVFVSNNSPLLGEQLILTYKIYTRIPIANIQLASGATYPGFWSQDLMQQQTQPKQQTEYINGQEYITLELRKVALFPLKSGKLTIDPMSIDLVAQIRSNNKKSRFNDPFFDSFFNDSFFNTGVEDVQMNIKSNKVTVNVKALPEIGKPESFDGAIGTYTFDCVVDKTECSTNDAITMKVVVSGKGNLSLVEPPVFNFPPDFEVYDPKVDTKLSSGSSGISGTKTFEYLIIPRKAGNFVIKPTQFSYYDLSSNKYVVKQTPEFNFKITKGSGSASTVTYTGAAQEDIKYIGTDIRHIMKAPFSLQNIGNVYFGSTWYYLLLILPFVLFVIFLLIWKEEIKKKNDLAGMKNRRANKEAVKRLKKANQLLKEKNVEGFYIEISQALWGYVGDKFNIPLSSLSIDTVKDALIKKGVKEDFISEFINVLNKCEFARFAPGDVTENMDNMYSEAAEVITHIENNK